MLEMETVNPNVAFCSTAKLLGHEHGSPSPYCLDTYKRGTEVELTLNHMMQHLSKTTLRHWEELSLALHQSNPKRLSSPQICRLLVKPQTKEKQTGQRWCQAPMQ